MPIRCNFANFHHPLRHSHPRLKLLLNHKLFPSVWKEKKEIHKYFAKIKTSRKNCLAGCRPSLPIEIINAKANVVEVRVSCDQCKQYIGNRIMTITEAEKQKNNVLCVKCKEKTLPNNCKNAKKG